VWLERRLHDTGQSNRNDRFDVAEELNALTGMALFFGRPAAGSWMHLAPTRRELPDGLGANTFPAYRVTEHRARAQTGFALCSGWHLYGGVTVGSQILTGLAHVQRLRRRFGAVLSVWPQQTGFGPDPFAGRGRARAQIVVAELWPTALAPPPAPGPEVVRDQCQVRDAVLACRRRQASPAGLGAWFDPPSLASGGAPARRIAREEGWILGIG
jgi:hypothetical protein